MCRETHSLERVLGLLARGEVFRFQKSDLSILSAFLVPCRQAKHIPLTIANNLQTVSLGCAPTPSQYFALLTSSLMSFCCLSPGAAPTGVCGIGLYVPRTSRGLESRAVLLGY